MDAFTLSLNRYILHNRSYLGVIALMLRLFSSAPTAARRIPTAGIASAVKAHFQKLDLNCDLGEGESPSRQRALMRAISSANIACGGHAGDLRSMDHCVRMAREEGVHVGAHPGYPDRENFGRISRQISPSDFELLLIQQISGLEQVARSNRMKLSHIKLHGALYHDVERDSSLAIVYLETVTRFWPKAKIFALAGGNLVEASARHDARVWEEIFADRAYRPNGTLVDREADGAVLSDLKEIVSRVQSYNKTGRMKTIAGSTVGMNARTICVHSDSENALRVARALADELG